MRYFDAEASSKQRFARGETSKLHLRDRSYAPTSERALSHPRYLSLLSLTQAIASERIMWWL